MTRRRDDTDATGAHAFDDAPTTEARRGLLIRAADPATASLLRLVNMFGGGGLAAAAAFVWMQFVQPFIAETRDLLHRGLQRQDVIARHLGDLETRLGVTAPITSDPAWLMPQQAPRSGGWLIGTAEGAQAPRSGVGEASGYSDADTSVDAPQVPVGTTPTVAGR